MLQVVNKETHRSKLLMVLPISLLSHLVSGFLLPTLSKYNFAGYGNSMIQTAAIVISV